MPFPGGPSRMASISTTFADMGRRIAGLVTRPFRRGPDWFLARARGIVHVGANTGQERQLYAKHRLAVVWVEPIPEVFERLRDNVQGFPGQRALRYLVTDKDGEQYTFHVANNEGASSSILDLHLHKELWPEVTYTAELTLRSIKLATLYRREGLDTTRFDTLVLDTQGSELLVLKGAAEVLPGVRYVKTEVADFESYQGCCTLTDVTRLLAGYGFRERRREAFAGRAGVGTYYDVLYENRRCRGVRLPREAAWDPGPVPAGTRVA